MVQRGTGTPIQLLVPTRNPSRRKSTFRRGILRRIQTRCPKAQSSSSRCLLTSPTPRAVSLRSPRSQSDPSSHLSPPPSSLSPVLFRGEQPGLKQSVCMSNASRGGAAPRRSGGGLIPCSESSAFPAALGQQPINIRPHPPLLLSSDPDPRVFGCHLSP